MKNSLGLSLGLRFSAFNGFMSNKSLHNKHALFWQSHTLIRSYMYV